MYHTKKVPDGLGGVIASIGRFGSPGTTDAATSYLQVEGGYSNRTIYVGGGGVKEDVWILCIVLGGGLVGVCWK